MVPWLRVGADPSSDAAGGSDFDEFSLQGTPVDAPRRSLRRVNGHSVNLPPARDLQADGQQSARERIPVLLFFDLWDCPYCDRALHEFLVPMATGEDWRARAIYRQVEIDKSDPLVDFDGRNTTQQAFAKRYNIKVTPTIQLVDGHGEPLGKPLLGLMTPDFYGAYLEQAITDATSRLQRAS